MAMLGGPQATSPLIVTVQTWYNSLPLCTKGTFSFITGIFILQLMMGWYGEGGDMYRVCLMPYDTLHYYQVYRLLSSVVIHAGLLHITFNMLAFVPIGGSLERLVGTVQFLYLLVLISVLEGLVYVATSVLLQISGLVPGAMHHCAVGFSGVIFGLIVIDTAQSGSSHRSIFGLFTVPAAWYPWALLVFWQLLMPSVSFVGHLAGVLVGQLWVWGYLRPLALPRAATSWLEQSWPLTRCIRFSSFIMMPGAILPYTMYDTARGGGGAGGSSGSGAPGAAGSRFGGLGRNLVTLGKLLRGGEGTAAATGGGGGSGGGAAAGEGGEGHTGAGGPDAEAAGSSRSVFVGPARVLGGGSTASAPASTPSVAAALAAEARVGGAGGGGPRGAVDKQPRS